MIIKTVNIRVYVGEGEKCLGWDWGTELEIKGCKPILVTVF